MATPEQETVHTESEPRRKDPMSMDMDELKTLIDTEGMEAEPPLVEEPEEEVGQEAAVEDEQEASAETQEATEDEQEQEPTAEFDAEDVMLRLEEAEKRYKHFESLASRQANEKGQWMSKAQELEHRLERLSQNQQDSDLTDTEFREPPQRQQPPANAGQDALLMQIALEREAVAFRERHPDAFTDDGNIAPDVAEALKEIGQEATNVFESKDPVEASQRTRNMLESAFSKADIQRTVTKRSERERRTADQAKGLKDKKRAAAISTSGGESAAPKQKTIDPMNMPLDDLKKLIDGANQ